MASECCPTHGLITPCHDCAMIAMANAVCSTCKAPTGVHSVLDNGDHEDPVECSALLGSLEYRRLQIAALELDPADYPMPEMSHIDRLGHMNKKNERDGGPRSANPNCSVHGCCLPRDEDYREAAGGYFCWCKPHGQWYEEERELKKRWRVEIKAAQAVHKRRLNAKLV